MNDTTVLLIERVFLAVIGIVFMVSGIFTFFEPHMMGEALGIAPLNASGETEIRATYGGLVVGSGLLVLSGLFNRLLAVAALAGTFFGAGGLMSTRIVIQATQGFTVNQAIVASFELTMVAVALLLPTGSDAENQGIQLISNGYTTEKSGLVVKIQLQFDIPFVLSSRSWRAAYKEERKSPHSPVPVNVTPPPIPFIQA